jgi:hypothetical protein
MNVFPLLERLVRWHPDLVDPGKLDKVLSASESDKAAVVLDALADVQSFAEPPAARIVGEQDIVPTGWSSETLTDGTPVIRVYDPSRFRDRLFLSALPDIVRDIQIARHVILDLRFQTRPTVVDIDPMLDFGHISVSHPKNVPIQVTTAVSGDNAVCRVLQRCPSQQSSMAIRRSCYLS